MCIRDSSPAEDFFPVPPLTISSLPLRSEDTTVDSLEEEKVLRRKRQSEAEDRRGVASTSTRHQFWVLSMIPSFAAVLALSSGLFLDVLSSSHLSSSIPQRKAILLAKGGRKRRRGNRRPSELGTWRTQFRGGGLFLVFIALLVTTTPPHHSL